MNYLRFTQYAYLIAGFFFAVDAFIKYQNDDKNAFLSGLFAFIGFFMFFFRRKYAKRFDSQNKK